MKIFWTIVSAFVAGINFDRIVEGLWSHNNNEVFGATLMFVVMSIIIITIIEVWDWS